MAGDYYRITLKPRDGTKRNKPIVWYTQEGIPDALASCNGLFDDNRLLEYFEIKAVKKVPDGANFLAGGEQHYVPN